MKLAAMIFSLVLITACGSPRSTDSGGSPFSLGGPTDTFAPSQIANGACEEVVSSGVSSSSALLETISTPKKEGTGATHAVVVSQEGEVFYKLQETTWRVGTLSAKTLNQIQAAIDGARSGEVERPEFVCDLYSSNEQSFMAEGGNVFLREGDPSCGASRYNSSPEAKKLIQFLRDLGSVGYESCSKPFD